MAHAYGWAFSNPLRKVYYNITVTGLSVAVALCVGTVELLQVLAALLSLNGGFWAVLNNVDFATLGYGIVALLMLTWALSYGVWKVRRIEECWTSLVRSR